MRIEYYISTFSNLDPVLVKAEVTKYKKKNDDELINILLELSKSIVKSPNADEQLSKTILDDELKFTYIGCTIQESTKKKEKKVKRRLFTRSTNNNLSFQKFD